jgi:hypothetical protein
MALVPRLLSLRLAFCSEQPSIPKFKLFSLSSGIKREISVLLILRARSLFLLSNMSRVTPFLGCLRDVLSFFQFLFRKSVSVLQKKICFCFSKLFHFLARKNILFQSSSFPKHSSSYLAKTFQLKYFRNKSVQTFNFARNFSLLYKKKN